MFSKQEEIESIKKDISDIYRIIRYAPKYCEICDCLLREGIRGKAVAVEDEDSVYLHIPYYCKRCDPNKKGGI